MNKIKLLLMILTLSAVLSACNLPGISGSPTQNPGSPVPTRTLTVNPIQTETSILTPTYSPTGTATVSPVLTPFLTDTPRWKIYNYTCDLAVGGATMTMNLTWTDLSTSEEGYKVYRDGNVIATLSPNSSSYTDIFFIATGKTVSYSVEAFTENWKASTSTIVNACQ